MTLVHVHCERCGECNHPELVDIVLLLPYREHTDLIPPRINLDCVACGEHEQIVSNEDKMKLLYAGVAVERYVVPLEFVEAHPDGPQFTHDDMIDFHQELECLPEWGIKL